MSSLLCSKPLGSNGTPIITLLKNQELDITPYGLTNFLVDVNVKLYYR